MDLKSNHKINRIRILILRFFYSYLFYKLFDIDYRLIDILAHVIDTLAFMTIMTVI